MPTLPMKVRHTATMVQPNNTFNDFNPLDVLATAASLQSARLTDGTSENHSESNGCEGTEEGGSDDTDANNTRRVIIKSIQSNDVVTKTDVIQTNGTISQNGSAVAKRADGDLNGLNGKHSNANGDVKKNSIIKLLEGSNTKVLTPQEGKSLLSLGKTTSAKVMIQDGKSVLAFPDGTKLVMPGKAVNKGVTVLKINKQQVSEHSYSFVCQLKNLRQDEDEGYNSRSSMDSEGEEHAAPSPGGPDSALGSPNPPAEASDAAAHGGLHAADLPSPLTAQGPLSPKIGKSPPTTKPAKIVIVKRDAGGVKQELSPKQLEDSKLMPSPGTNGGVGGSRSVVLRTLLKQKPVLKVLPAGDQVVSPETSSSTGTSSTSSVQAESVEHDGQLAVAKSQTDEGVLNASGPVQERLTVKECTPREEKETVTLEPEESLVEQDSGIASVLDPDAPDENTTVDDSLVGLASKETNCRVDATEETEPDAMETDACESTTTTALDREVTEITAEMTSVSEQPGDEAVTNDTPSLTAATSVSDTGADQGISSDSIIGQGETVHITNTEETDCVSVGSPEVVMSDPVVSPLSTQPSTTTVQLLVTTSPPKTTATSLSNLTGLLQGSHGLLQGGQQSRLTTKLLHQQPVAAAGNGVVHVIPVSAVKGLTTTAVVPRTVQYLAQIPSSAKTTGLVRVQPAGGATKLMQPTTTIIVPATSVAGIGGRHNRLLPVIGPAMTKPVEGIQTIKFASGGDAIALAPRPASVTGGLLARMKTPPLVGASRSLTPVAAFSSGGVTTSSGRTTPINNPFMRSTTLHHSTREQVMSPGEKINLKISSSNITESSSSEMETSPIPSKEMATTSIGTLGSLSMKSLEGLDDTAKTEKANGLSKGEFIRIQGSSLRISSAGMEERSDTPCSSLGSPESDISSMKSPNVSRPNTPALDSIEGSSRTGQTYRRVRQRKMRIGEGEPEPYLSGFLSSATELHPVVDHDYCKFTDLCGDIQRSIIATSECKARIERKTNKKTRAARVAKDVSVPAVLMDRPGRPRKQDKIAKVLREKQVRTKKGRYKKKEKIPVYIPKEVKVEEIFDEDQDLMVPTSDDESTVSVQDSSEERKEKKKSNNKKEKPEKKLRWRSDKSKNYVKITGSYQDEFVYFTSKNHRKAPRKFEGPLPDSSIIMGKSPKLPPVGGTVNVFDWYRDMAKTDKTQFGGISGNATPSGEASPNTTNLQNSSFTDLSSSGYTGSSAARSGPATSQAAPTSGPRSEAEVVDLVCELSGLGGNETVEPLSHDLGTNDLDMSTFLNSIGEDALQMLESSVKTLGSSSNHGSSHSEEVETKPDATPLHETSFDGFLTNLENGQSLSQVSNPICDLDEINDHDLLQSDIGNMNAFLGSESTAAHGAGGGNNTQQHSGMAVSTAADETNLTAVPPSVANPLFKPTPDVVPSRLDKSELFADWTSSQPDALSSEVTAPDLTVVSMYWNDLPGLLINSEQYVRLVDIHKQVLPAKDTGILKKRCQMMGLPIHNCSELQRDFLMRYANAAKSKSTVIVSKESAKTLIGFYVDPRPRTRGDSHCSREDVHSPTRADMQETYMRKESGLSGSTVDHSAADIAATPTAAAGDGDAKVQSGGKGRPRKRKLLASPPRTPMGIPKRHISPRIHLGSLSSTEVKRSARLQHKRVRYDEMVMGNHPFTDESSADSPFGTPLKVAPLKLKLKRPVLTARRQIAVPMIPREDDDDSNVSSDHENKDITNVLRPVFPEEHEIKRLRARSQRFRLSSKEKVRLRRLKERMRRSLMEHRKHLKERRMIAAEKQKNAQMKSKRKLLETHLYTKKYNQEHCYAACPENFDKSKNGGALVDGSDGSSSLQEVEIQPEDIRVEEVVVVPDASGEGGVIHRQPGEPDVKPPDVNGNDVAHEKQEPMVIGDIVVSDAAMETEVEHVEGAQGVKEEPKEEVRVKQEKVVEELLDIVHRDATRSGRGRWQDGTLHLHLYNDREVPCVTCVLCNELLPVKRFMKHMHPYNRVDELIEITLPQRMELKKGENATEHEQQLWSKFQALQAEHNKTAEKQTRAKTRRSQEVAAVPVKEEPVAEVVTEEKPITVKVEPVEPTAVSPKPTMVTPKVEEKKTSRSPRTPASKESVTPIRNGQVSGGKNRTREMKSVAKMNVVSGVTPTTPLQQQQQAKPLTPSALAKLEMPPTVGASDASPQDANVRQSGRVRKRKQLHPCESYVFSSGRNLTAEGVPESKRVKLDNTAEG